ncbi:MAG TPA: hypothetical protein VM328_06815 [Fimbriimonadaceae bacterium]|nr:hypothetical protein [Fimbriimonadaceae bacterium]
MRGWLSLPNCCAALLFLSSAIGLLIYTVREGYLGHLPTLLCLGVAASAALLMKVASIFVPDLFAVGRLQFPLYLTLPIVYHALLLTVLVLIASSQSSIQQLPRDVEVVFVWWRPDVLGSSLVAGVLILLSAGLLSRRRLGV